MKIRTDFVTNSSSSSFIACGVLSKELADFVKELLDGKTSAYSETQVGMLTVSDDIVSVTTTVDFGGFYILSLLEDDKDHRTRQQRAIDNKNANTPQNIANAFSDFLPEVSAEQKNRLEQLLQDAAARKCTAARVYVDQTDGFEEMKFDKTAFASARSKYARRYGFSADWAPRNGTEWLRAYGHLVAEKPQIVFKDKLFVFTGLEEGDTEHKEVLALGGIWRDKISGKTDYLVVKPSNAGMSKIEAVIAQREKGKHIEVVLMKDLKKVLQKHRPAGAVASADNGPLAGKTIVVTGDLVRFPEPGKYPERKKFRALVEKHGGKLGSSITKKTDFLVCNDTSKATVKVKEARENNIPIISEKEFLSMIDSIKK